MKKIKVGDLVIVSDVDQPSARMIAVVSSIKCGVYKCRYLSTFPNMKKPVGANPTLVSDFGIKVVFGNNHYCAVQVGESRAKYKDGQWRRWQPSGSPIQKCRAAAQSVYWGTRRQRMGGCSG